jgi:hypothetical protein
LIEYSARHAARLWQAPPGADNFQLQRKRKRYQGDFLDAFPSEKDFEETAEKRRKLRHQLEQAVERAKTGP